MSGPVIACRLAGLSGGKRGTDMDLSFLNKYMVIVVVGICLIAGYIAKKWIKDMDNKYIPTMVALLGIAINIWIAGGVSPEVILAGAFSGLASTGLHQVFKQLIDGPLK